MCIRLGNVSSAFGTVNIGDPQGSILGPLLFLYSSHDQPNVSKLLPSGLFAHDTTLYASGNYVSSMMSFRCFAMDEGKFFIVECKEGLCYDIL